MNKMEQQAPTAATDHQTPNSGIATRLRDAKPCTRHWNYLQGLLFQARGGKPRAERGLLPKRATVFRVMHGNHVLRDRGAISLCELRQDRNLRDEQPLGCTSAYALRLR